MSSCGKDGSVIYEHPGSTRDLPWLPWFFCRCLLALEGSCCICGSEHCCSHIMLLVFCGDNYHDSQFSESSKDFNGLKIKFILGLIAVFCLITFNSLLDFITYRRTEQNLVPELPTFQPDSCAKLTCCQQMLNELICIANRCKVLLFPGVPSVVAAFLVSSPSTQKFAFTNILRVQSPGRGV